MARHETNGEKGLAGAGLAALGIVAGDRVMVVFNDPVQVDNPALRAVLMALEKR